LQNDFKRKLLASPHRAALAKHYGNQAFDLWDCDARSFSPEIEQEQVRISALSSEYTELLASASFEFRGEKLNMPGLGKYFADTDRATRHEAQKLRWDWMAGKREKLDTVFHDLTQLRHVSATKLGLNSYEDLGYLRMHRVDYDFNDVSALRAQVTGEVVPLCAELVKRQARALGIDKVKM